MISFTAGTLFFVAKQTIPFECGVLDVSTPFPNAMCKAPSVGDDDRSRSEGAQLLRVKHQFLASDPLFPFGLEHGLHSDRNPSFMQMFL